MGFGYNASSDEVYGKKENGLPISQVLLQTAVSQDI